MSAYRSDSRVKFTYELKADDVRRASDGLKKRDLAAALVVPALFGSVVVGTLLWSVPTLRGALLAAGVVGVTVWFVRIALNPPLQIPAAAWKKRIDVEATDEALETSAADSGTRLGWDVLGRWVETDTDFYIYRSTFHYHLIPKRELDPATQVALRKLLAEHLPQNQRAHSRAAHVSRLPFVVGLCFLLLALGTVAEALGRFP